MIDMSKLSGVYFTVEEAAGYAGMTRGRLAQMLRAGEIDALKVSGRCWLISKNEADRVKSQKHSVGRPRIAKMAS